MIARIVILSMLYVVPFLGCTQVYPIKKFSVHDGLSHSNVFRITQDKKGFLWFSTNYGFSRFDGNDFVNYTALRTGAVMSISELSTEDKLVSTLDGLYRLSGDSLSYEQ